jgi:hypothetical protein
MVYLNGPTERDMQAGGQTVNSMVKVQFIYQLESLKEVNGLMEP